MRTTNFRIWFPEEKRMIYKGMLTFDLSDGSWLWEGRHGSFHSHFGKKMEGTGITIMTKVKGSSIKQEKELFEGDIIRVSKADVVTIVWNEQIAGFDTEPRISYADRGWRETVIDHRGEIELLGNILENPDLNPNI